MKLLSKMLVEERGQGLTEYAFILVFVALAVIAALGNMGAAVAQVFQHPTLMEALE
ncbi:MAG: Flp family type IVb pilin [Syntrophomonadaceae bacterium]|jgi:Flp pilus assembly pilin Flp|nr:Flp family type IVb pilin [Syntrophomonadaceae bacterium]